MKNKCIILLMSLLLLSFSCSIDRTLTVKPVTITTEQIQPSAEHPWGGHYIYFYTGDELTNSIFVSNGEPGKDGINGIDGIDGKDGVSASLSTEQIQPSAEHPWGGWLLTFGIGSNTETLFISNGANGLDGQDGLSSTITSNETQGGIILTITNGTTSYDVFVKDGQDGIDGLNGTNATIRTEAIEGGYNLYITENDETTVVFISHGIDGTDGQNGTNGLDGIDGLDGVYSTIRTEKIEPSAGHPWGGYNLYITVDGVTTGIFISNGADGTNGLDGIDGQDGWSSSVVVDEYEGEFCEWGGYVIITTSTNPAVQDQHTYICNCQCEVEEDPCDDEELNKVEICHKENKNGSPSRYHTIWVAQSAVQDHLNHGDKLGNCDDCEKW